MTKIDYIQFEPKALMADLSQFNAPERGCYVSLFTWLYLNKGRCIKDLKVIRKICGNPHYFDKIWSNIKHKFPEKDGYIYHKRVGLELRAAKKRVQIAHDAGVRGAEARWNKQGDRSTNAMPPHSGRITNINSNINTNIHTYTQGQVENSAVLVGIPKDKAEAFFHHYNAQGWLLGNGMPIVDLGSALARWRNNQYKFDKQKSHSKSGKQKLWPIPSKHCSERGCQMPAVYKWTSGAGYDFWSCSKHLPDKVKELYE